MEASETTATDRAAILVVDDEDSIRGLLRRYLGTKYSCSTSVSAEDALTILGSKTFQVVIADIGLPGSSGLDLCASIKTRFPDTVVMMITGLAEAQYASKAMAAGAFTFLAKPVDLGRLSTLVEDALKHQAQLTQRRSRGRN